MTSARSAATHTKRPGYHPGLDGIRAFSIIAVLLFHGGVAWAAGGFLGVEVFFVLSGFLITSLLVGEWRRRSTISLGSFWGRRARRLFPALLVLVAVIGVYYMHVSPDRDVPGLEGDGLATLLYVGNWHAVAIGSNYFAANGQVSPLEHTWSLAIEEQFYLVWPLVVLGVLWLARRRGRSRERGPLTALLSISVLGVLVSALDSALQMRGGAGLDRVYYGTDTRAAGLLVGASLAIGLALLDVRGRGRAGRSDAPSRRRRAVQNAVPAVALAVILIVMHAANGSALWLYPYGLLLVDLAVVGLIASIVISPASHAARLFALAPIRWIGAISYGIYLWHFPLFLWLDNSTTGASGAALLGLRLAVTLAVSVASFYIIEQPIRQRRVPDWLLRPLVPLAVGGSVAALVVAGAVESGAGLAAVPTSQIVPASLRGDAQCVLQLKDTSNYGLAPLSPAQAAKDEPAWLVGHKLKWGRTSEVAFRTCPPRRVMVIGDSLAFTLGVGLMENEQAYGVEVADAAILGCAFNDRGDLNSRGKWESQYAGCPTALQTWAQDERTLRAQAVIVELGYRDEFDWRVNGQLEQIGDAAYDAYVIQRINDYVQVLGRGDTPILFLTVPWSNPPALPDGSPAPAASPARHAWINQALRAVAAEHPGQVQVLDVDRIISPGNHYDATINGKLCRFDGVHFTVYCSRLMQPSVLEKVRSMIGS